MPVSVRPPLRLRAASRGLAVSRSVVLAAIGASLLGAVSPVAAQADPIRGFVEKQMPAGAGRVEITVGALDPRLQLAPCARIEPYLLPGTRLWGRTVIGVRCLEGASWTVAMPVTVTIHGRAVIAGEPMTAGTAPSSSALRVEVVELTREPGTPVTDTAQLVGKTLIRPLAPGQVLRLEHLKVASTIAAGDPVRIQMVGQGFSIQADGQALAAAGEGQSLRVRTENGRILAGTLRGRTVEVRI
ncbi:MAG: flagellar basal body P-ring formation chaperone FlgA [Burkholderiaceae bacterium]